MARGIHGDALFIGNPGAGSCLGATQGGLDRGGFMHRWLDSADLPNIRRGGGAAGVMGTMFPMSSVSNRHMRHVPHMKMALMAIGAAGVLLIGAGCTKPLFPESAPRTQFEKFDAMRTGAAPKDEPDVFGTPQPALRARLAPKTTES